MWTTEGLSISASNWLPPSPGTEIFQKSENNSLIKKINRPIPKDWALYYCSQISYYAGFPAGPFFLGGRLHPPPPKKKLVTPPQKFLLTLFLITLSPPTPRLLPPKVLQLPPPKRWNPAGNPVMDYISRGTLGGLCVFCFCNASFCNASFCNASNSWQTFIFKECDHTRVIPCQITQYFVWPRLGFCWNCYQRFYSRTNGQIQSLSAVVQVVFEIWSFYCAWYASHFERNLRPYYFGLFPVPHIFANTVCIQQWNFLWW